jgi:rare lipoprotein A
VRQFFSICILLLSVFLTSCGGSGYKGYQQFGYTIRGQYYQPMSVDDALRYDEVGEASWYDESSYFGLVRGDTSLGEKVMPFALSAAHKTLPIPCRVKISNLENGKSVKLRVNDRGPFIPGRIIDVTPRAAGKLGFKKQGLIQVRVEVLSVGDGKYKRKVRQTWWPF